MDLPTTETLHTRKDTDVPLIGTSRSLIGVGKLRKMDQAFHLNTCVHTRNRGEKPSIRFPKKKKALASDTNKIEVYGSFLQRGGGTVIEVIPFSGSS